MNNPHLNIQLSVKDRRAGQNNSRGRRWRESFKGALEVVVRRTELLPKSCIRKSITN